MKYCKNIPEILSPVGNEEMLYAAVRAGADAVYLGAKNFNARRNADNFSSSSLKAAIDYCHIRGVSVYLTLNIQLKDSELQRALELSVNAYNMGIDALIIADLGLAALLHKKLPFLPLHASTQMTVCNKSALLPLKKLGFVRVVAAREMSEKELYELCDEAKKLNMEIEVFVHGALCMCMSGQCLLSALLGGRSGNRGLCAGPCRLPYSDSFGNKYTLSLKDLSLLDYVDRLKEMGVASLKIEGRMKRSEYVAAATASFRSMVDKGYVDPSLKGCLENVFSRSGFTDGYFTEKTGKEMFGIRTKDDAALSPDTYPTLHEIIRFERSSVPIKIYAEINEAAPVKIIFSDGEHTAEVTGAVPEKAINRPITEEWVEGQLTKLGTTPYYAENIQVSVGDGLMIRASLLNEMRRNACAVLDEMRSKVIRKPETPFYIPEVAEKKPTTQSFWIYLNDLSLLPEDLSKISAVLLPIEKNHDLSLLPHSITAIADISRAGLFSNALEERLKKAKEQGFTAVLVQNIGHIEAAKKSGLTLIAGQGMNIFSSRTLLTLKDTGFKGAVLSPELTASEINKIVPHTETVLFAYGRLPLMLTKNCPASFEGCKNCNGDRFLTDRKGIRFPIRCRMGYSELLCDRPVWLADRQKEFSVDAFLLYFTDESKERIAQIIKAYKNNTPADIPFTRGMYYRGVE